MEEQCSPLGLASYYQDEGFFEELKHSLLYSTLELEAAVVSAHEEISRKDKEILQLKALVETVVKQRDEFEAKCAQLVFEKNLLSQRLSIGPQSSKQHSECPCSSNTVSNQEDDTNVELVSASDGDNNNSDIIVASSSCTKTLSPPLELVGRHRIVDVLENIPIKMPLPENGKFLQAIMEAGPLLQTLLLAGPLPRWQHPPPQLNSGDIPPVKIFSPTTKILLQDPCLSNSPTTSGGLTNKRPVMMTPGSQAFSPNSKHKKVGSPTIIDPIDL